MDSFTLAVAGFVNEVGEERDWTEGDPHPFVLRENAECERLLDTLEELGVTEWRYGAWADEFGSDFFMTFPHFKERGVRYSAAHLESVRAALSQLALLLDDAIRPSLAGTTNEEEANLMVVFVASIRRERREIRATIRAIESFRSLSGDYAVRLL